MLPLSIAIIAHNEADNIRRCLDSVKDIAGEIVLVINDCTDGTDEIALKEYGARVFHERWHGHRDQKNIALSKTTKPWVLCIDCDEELDPGLKGEIVKFVEADSPDYDGAYFPRKLWFMGRWIKHGDWYPDYSLRLIRRGRGKWGGSREHDKMQVKGQVKKLKGELLHYSFPDLNQQMQKMCYYSDVFLQRQLEAETTWSPFRPLSHACWAFFRHYILRRGFLDGFPGLYIGWLQAWSVFFKYSKLYEFQKKSMKRPQNGAGPGENPRG